MPTIVPRDRVGESSPSNAEPPPPPPPPRRPDGEPDARGDERVPATRPFFSTSACSGYQLSGCEPTTAIDPCVGRAETANVSVAILATTSDGSSVLQRHLAATSTIDGAAAAAVLLPL